MIPNSKNLIISTLSLATNRLQFVKAGRMVNIHKIGTKWRHSGTFAGIFADSCAVDADTDDMEMAWEKLIRTGKLVAKTDKKGHAHE
jgi:hypothetical protein